MMLDRSSNSQIVTHSAFTQREIPIGDAPEAPPAVDFGFVFRVIRRRAKMIVAFMVLAMAVAIALVMIDTPLYQASSRVIIERRNVDVLQQESVMTDPALNPAEADGQLQVIGSDKVIGNMIQNLNLLANPAFEQPAVDGPVQTLRANILQALSSIEFLRPFIEGTPPAALSDAERLQLAIARVQQEVDVRRVGLSYVFVIDVSWTDPALAAQIANGIADAYIADRMALRSGETEIATGWLDERLAELRQSADAAEAVVSQFKIDNNIVEAGREGLLNEQQVATLSNQLSAAMATTRDSRDELSRFTQITAQTILTAPLGNDDVEQQLRTLRDELVTLEDRRAQTAQQFGADHFTTLEIVQQIVRLNERISAEVTRVRATLEASYAIAQTREEEVRQSLQAMTVQSAAVGGAQVKLQALQSEAAVYRSLYDNYLQRYMQSVQQQSFPTADARVIAPAVVPDHDNTDGTRLAIIALAVGASLGLAAALIRERMDRSVRTPWQLRLATGVPTISMLPKLTAQAKPRPALNGPRGGAPIIPALNQFRLEHTPYGMVLASPMSQFTEAIRRIKVAIDNAAQHKPLTIVGFVSSDDIASRGVVATNYAQLLAAAGHRTLLIDLDLRNVGLTRAITPLARGGIADYSTPGSAADIQGAVWKDQVSNLHFMPARDISDTDGASGVLLNADRLMRNLAQLSGTYEYLVLDFAPLTVSADAAALADMVSGYILVSEWGKTSGDAVAKQISDSGIPYGKLLGSVLGEVDLVKYRKYEDA